MKMATNYAECNIKTLKDELRKRGARLSGRKHDLIERLQAYDRNQNFGEVLENEHYNMDIPQLEFKDINTDTKLTVTEENVKVYMDLFQQDLQKKSIDLYNGKFLRSVRTAVDASGNTYICARVSAEMTKKCIYKVDIKFDSFGVVKEAQCECAAGMGPEAHCKHVGVVLYAITQAHKGIITEVSCTQRLQTFHQVKQYSGSPVKMENLLLRDESSRLKLLKDFDPRPLANRNQVGYRGHFRAVWLNSSAANCPIRQLYNPANLYGINNDHDYLEKSPEDMFLEHTGITFLTQEQSSAIELKTRGQNRNKLWKEERLLRLHSSSCGKIIKMTQRTDAMKLAKSLTEYRNVTSDAIKHGRKYEETARTAYEKNTDTKVFEYGICVNTSCPFIGCSPDGLVGDDGLVEIKCPYTARDKTISPNSVPYLYLDDNSNLCLRADHDYYYQVMCNLLCTSRKWCDFIVWTFKDIKVIRISRHEDCISKIRSSLQMFFQNYFRQVLLEKFFYQDSHTFLPQ